MIVLFEFVVEVVECKRLENLAHENLPFFVLSNPFITLRPVAESEE